MNENLRDRVVLVTGASRGIGRATADAIVAMGGRAIYAARSRSEVEAAAGVHPDRALGLACDVTSPEAVDALYEAIAARFGRLDGVFNNAGASLPATEIGDVSFEDWRRVLSVNTDGAFLIARGAFRMMREQDPKGGRIVNNGSISAYVPRIGSAPYTASKHAISGLTRAIALDGRKHAIACSQVDIGNAASDMTDAMTKGVPQADGSLAVEPVMDVAHVATHVARQFALPLDVNVLFSTIMATTMPYVGRG